MFKFPNARLFVYELLSAERLSGPEAMARGASQLGLISPHAVKDVLAENHTHQCSCMATAKNIVKRHFEERPARSGSEVDTEEVWSDIEKQFNQAPQIKTCSYRCACSDSDNSKHSDGCNQSQQPPCQKHAPALIDLMLQQIIRYT